MRHLFVVTRIEGANAVLETQRGASFVFPVNLLPQPIKEGLHLRFNIEIDQIAQAQTADQIQSVRDQLKKQSRS